MSLAVTLIASTLLFRERLDNTPYTPHPFPSATETVMAADELIEFAARSRHGSWDRPDPNTASNEDYLSRLLSLQEASYFEHASASFWVTGASLAFASELRQAAPYLAITEASLRYRSLDGLGMVAPAALMYDEGMSADLEDTFEEAKETAIDVERQLRKDGFVREASRDSALAFLPLSTETTLLVTGNILQWRSVISESGAIDASAPFFTFGSEVYWALRQYAPNALQGIEPVRHLRPVASGYDEPENVAA